MIVPNFNITPGNPIGDLFLQKNVKTFYDAIRYIHNLPYGRLENPLEFENILMEGKGTCSTKHALLKTLAEEHLIYGLQLSLAIYAMDDSNTPKVGPILKKYNLPYMLEAHTFLTYDDETYDYTFPKSYSLKWQESVLIQTTIDTDQIGEFKKEYHKSVLADWITRDKIPYTLEKMWSIREECIDALNSSKII